MQIASQPHVLTDMVLTIGADDYEAHVSSCSLVPSTDAPRIRWKGLTPSAEFTATGTPVTTWDLVLNACQDWETANSLSQYLYDHAGTVTAVELSPQRGVGKTFTFEVTIVPGQVGGDVDAVAITPVTMPVEGTPAMTPWSAV